MNKIFSGCTLSAIFLLAGCVPSQIPELTMKAEYRPSAQIKGADAGNDQEPDNYIAFEEQGNPEKIDVLYCFGGEMYLQTSDEHRNIDMLTSADKECEIFATFPGEFKKYAIGGFKGWRITPIPPREHVYTFSEEELKSIKEEYKSIDLPKQSSVKIVPQELKLSFGRTEIVKTEQLVKGNLIDLAMKNYRVPPAMFQIEAFSELKNVPGFPDQIKSGYGLVKFLYPWRIQFKFFAYREGASNKEKYKGLKDYGTNLNWIDAIYVPSSENTGLNGEQLFRIPVYLPARDKSLKIGLALRLVFNTDYPDDVITYPEVLKHSLYNKISWTGATKNNEFLDPEYMVSRWNIAVIDEVISNSCSSVQTHFTFGKDHKVSFQTEITVSDVSK